MSELKCTNESTNDFIYIEEIDLIMNKKDIKSVKLTSLLNINIVFINDNIEFNFETKEQAQSYIKKIAFNLGLVNES